MEHRVWFDDEKELLCIQYRGELTADDMRNITATANDHLIQKAKVRVLVDYRHHSGMLSSEVRRELKNNPLITPQDRSEKIGVVLPSRVGRMFAKIAMAAIGRLESTKFFETEPDAVAWLLDRDE